MTLREALADQARHEAAFDRRCSAASAAAAADRAKSEPPANLDPRVGVLLRGGRCVFYAYVGSRRTYVESADLARVEAALRPRVTFAYRDTGRDRWLDRE
jgi:hypothetical protein